MQLDFRKLAADTLLMASTAVVPRIRPDRAGYWLGDEAIDGFGDDPSLDGDLRLVLARWAQRFTPEALTQSQRDLIASPPGSVNRASALDDEVLRAAIFDAEDGLPADVAVAFYRGLSQEQLALVLDPSPALDGAGYPLTITQLAELSGASARQLRDWEKAGLLPAERIGGRRSYYSAAVVRAFRLVSVRQHEIAVHKTIAGGGDAAATLIVSLMADIGALVSRLPGGASAELMNAVAMIIDHSDELKATHSRPSEPVAGPPGRGVPFGRGGQTLARSTRTGPMSAPNNRHVTPRPDGNWNVIAPGATRPSAVLPTQSAGIDRAREIVDNLGGGEVVVHRPNGQIRDSDTVGGRSDRVRSRG